jgi:hypothetical protein
MDYSPTKEHPTPTSFHVHVTTTMTTKESYPSSTVLASASDDKSNLPNRSSGTHIISGIWGDSILKDPGAGVVQTTISTAQQKREAKIRHRILLWSIIFVACSLVGGVITIVASAHYRTEGKGGSGEAGQRTTMSEVKTPAKTTATKSVVNYTNVRNPFQSILPQVITVTVPTSSGKETETMTTTTSGSALTKVVTALTTTSTVTTVTSVATNGELASMSTGGVGMGQGGNGSMSSTAANGGV